MDLSKSLEFFKPDSTMVHIVGCGSVGSTIAENLARCGVKNMTLWDFDKVEPHNVANQMFRQQDISKMKVDALKDILLEINPDIIDGIKLKPNGWKGEMLSGYIFLAVDSIEIRQEIVKKHYDNAYVKAMFDCRTGLTGAQGYCAIWQNRDMKEKFLASMNFSHEEAAEETPVSACGVTLGVMSTVRIVSALTVNNYIKVVKGETPWKFFMFDGFAGTLDAFE